MTLRGDRSLRTRAFPTLISKAESARRSIPSSRDLTLRRAYSSVFESAQCKRASHQQTHLDIARGSAVSHHHTSSLSARHAGNYAGTAHPNRHRTNQAWANDADEFHIHRDKWTRQRRYRRIVPPDEPQNAQDNFHNIPRDRGMDTTVALPP